MENEKIAKVVDKLDDEVKGRDVLEAIAEMLKDAARRNDGICDSLLDPKKTLKEAYAAMYDVAKKKKSGGSYCMTPQEALSVIGNYYGVDLNEEKKSKIADVCENTSSTVSLFDMI